jgi:hypothetical protein
VSMFGILISATFITLVISIQFAAGRAKDFLGDDMQPMCDTVRFFSYPERCTS